MTWGEWVDSEYNEIGAYLRTDGIVFCSNLNILASNYSTLYSNDVILPGESYIIRDYRGGLN